MDKRSASWKKDINRHFDYIAVFASIIVTLNAADLFLSLLCQPLFDLFTIKKITPSDYLFFLITLTATTVAIAVFMIQSTDQFRKDAETTIAAWATHCSIKHVLPRLVEDLGESSRGRAELLTIGKNGVQQCITKSIEGLTLTDDADALYSLSPSKLCGQISLAVQGALEAETAPILIRAFAPTYGAALVSMEPALLNRPIFPEDIISKIEKKDFSFLTFCHAVKTKKDDTSKAGTLTDHIDEGVKDYALLERTSNECQRTIDQIQTNLELNRHKIMRHWSFWTGLLIAGALLMFIDLDLPKGSLVILGMIFSGVVAGQMAYIVWRFLDRALERDSHV